VRLQAVEQALHVARRNAAAFELDREAERRQRLVELGDIRHVGRLVDAVGQGNVARAQVLGHRAVGLEHELLDHAMRVVALLEAHADAAPRVGQIDKRLG
jgi:hypothetical protein